MINILYEDIFTSPLLAKPKRKRAARVDKGAIIEAQAARIRDLEHDLDIAKGEIKDLQRRLNVLKNL